LSLLSQNNNEEETPSCPININTINKSLEIREICEVIPVERPVVPKAEATSNNKSTNE
jgi:hypothetical protein